MSFKNIKHLRSLLRSPDTMGRIYWLGKSGYSFGSKRKAIEKDNAFVFLSDELPEHYDKPEYESSNPYQAKSLEFVNKFQDGIVVDFGSGNPKHSFPNICQIDIRKYPDTDIVVAGGNIPLKSNSIDAVISEAVLEHVKDPFHYVAEIYRILKPKGEVLLDTAFMQPLHAYPHHYFNTTAYAVRLLFERFKIDKLFVGPHQHPWISFNWILNSYYNGLNSDDARAVFRNMTIGDVMSLLNHHQSLRSEIKESDDPWFIAQNLKEFNINHTESLGPFLNITNSCENELAAGLEIHAYKP